MQILNATTGKKERVGKLFQMHSNKENPVEEAFAGHIYAFIGLKDTTTGDTLADPANPIQLESMSFPEPVISVAIEPKTKGDQEKLGVAIQKLAKEDPTFQVELDEETGQTVIKGMGELHLDILVDRMRREFNVEANIGKPQVAYRETIKRTVEKFDFTHKKQTGGSGQFAKVQLTFGPLTDAEDGVFYEFENKVTGGRIPREYIPSVDAGIQTALQNGITAGYPVVNVKVIPPRRRLPRRRLLEMALKIAGFMAAKEALRKAQPVILEPLDGRRGPHSEGVHGRCDRRPELQARSGSSRWRTRAGSRSFVLWSAVRDVRVRRRPAVQDPGSCDVHDAVRQLRGVPPAIAEEIIAKTRGE